MSTPRQDALRMIAEAGAELFESDAAHFDVTAWAPPGKAWTATGGHALVAHNYTSRPEGWRALRDDLRAGVEPCTAEDCETCGEVAP